MSIKWLDETTGIINNGKRYMFKGIIRGQDFPAITYFADSPEEITSSLVLDEWIYRIEKCAEK